MSATLIFIFLFACWLVWVWFHASTVIPPDPNLSNQKLPAAPLDKPHNDESGFIFWADDFEDFYGNH